MAEGVCADQPVAAARTWRQDPHTYGPDQPCLFYPNSASWRSDMRLADKIVPWLSLWLAFYEMWRATGDWYGGGITHGELKEIEPTA